MDTGQPQQCIEGAPDIVFDHDTVVQLDEDETAIMLYIQDFTLSRPEIVGNKKCQFLLSVDFYDHEIQNTQLFSPSEKDFSVKFLFPCKNDIQLKEYLQKGSVKVQLVKITGINATPIGEDEFSLKRFLEGSKFFSSKLVFRTLDQNIEFAESNYQVGIYIPVIK